VTLGELFTALGYAVGAFVFWWAAREKRLATEGIGRLAVIGFLTGVSGAKITELLAMGWPVRVPALVVLEPQVGGRALLGGMIFGWIGVEVAKRRIGIRRSTGDLFALALPAGEAIGRIGCYFNGCCYGKVCNLPWAIYQHDAWRHPTQAYSGITAAVIFGLLFGIRKKTSYEGQLFWIYLLLFGASRFVIEQFRWQTGLVMGMSSMQWFCMDLIALSSFKLIRNQLRQVRALPQKDTGVQ
jgi:phosphatidylglycerol:prolipoprotein diacylglycerol transferase